MSALHNAGNSRDDLQARFLGMLPRIETHARIFFRALACPAKKEDAIQETVAICWMWFLRLAKRGKDASQFVSTLASLAARHVKDGRRLCGREKSKDVLSPLAQTRRGFLVGTLPAATRHGHENLWGSPHGQEQQDAFEERLQDNHVTPVPDQVAFRLDFPAWLQTLTLRERRIINAMMQNERTNELSRQFEVSPGRISRLRRAVPTRLETVLRRTARRG